MPTQVTRGEIYFVSLDPVVGHEQRGRRPVLVVSADSINRLPLVVTVVVGTDASKVPQDYPTNVRVSAADTGLPMDTVFYCMQIRSLDHSRFVDPVRPGTITPAGSMPKRKMTEIEGALRYVLGMT
jgi:mRNA interferase MazF